MILQLVKVSNCLGQGIKLIRLVNLKLIQSNYQKNGRNSNQPISKPMLKEMAAGSAFCLLSENRSAVGRETNEVLITSTNYVHLLHNYSPVHLPSMTVDGSDCTSVDVSLGMETMTTNRSLLIQPVKGMSGVKDRIRRESLPSSSISLLWSPVKTVLITH